MNQITWTLKCHSQELLRKVEQQARIETNLDKQFVTVSIAFPNGIENQEITNHRIGDYFSKVDILAEALSLHITFHPKQNANSYWKDIMADILDVLQTSDISSCWHSGFF